MPATALVYITDLHSPIMILIYSMNYTTSTSCWSFIDAVLSDSIVYEFLCVPESCPISNACLQPLTEFWKHYLFVSYATIVSLLPLASRWYKFLSVSCMLSQSVTAFFQWFIASSCIVLCNCLNCLYVRCLRC